MSEGETTMVLDPSTQMLLQPPVGGLFDEDQYFTTLVEDRRSEVDWYSRFFVGHDHVNYIGRLPTTPPETVVVSVMATCVPDLGWQYRVILWQKRAVSHYVFEVPVGESMDFRGVLEAIDPGLAVHQRAFARVTNQRIHNALARLENDEPRLRIKIGVLFARHGQTDETSMYQNETGSPAFEEFLGLLGTRVRLKGFTGYSAQLDTEHDGSGTHSVTRRLNGYDIMFHVSTLLQNDPTDEQRIQRKRFIGNDIVMIVFMDGTTTYNIDCMASQYTRVVAVVQPYQTDKYRISFGYMKGLRQFAPPVFEVYRRDEAAIECLLSWCINGEKSCKASPEFVIREQRTRGSYLDIIYDDYFDAKLAKKKQQKKDNVLDIVPLRTFELAAHTHNPEVTNAFHLRTVMSDFAHHITSVTTHASNVYFATIDGLYVSRIGSLACRRAVLVRNLLQAQAIASSDLMLVRTDAILLKLSLSALEADSDPMVTMVPIRKPTLFSADDVNGETRICVADQDHRVTCLNASLEALGQISFDGPISVLQVVPAMQGVVVAVDTTFFFVSFSSMTPQVIKQGLAAGTAPKGGRRGSGSTAAIGGPKPSTAAIAAVPVRDGVLVCYDNIGYTILNDLSTDPLKEHVYHWVGRPVSFSVQGDQLLVVVYTTFAEIRSLANGTLVETHVSTTPEAFTCYGEHVYLPSWQPSTQQASLFQLVPQRSPFLASLPRSETPVRPSPAAATSSSSSSSSDSSSSGSSSSSSSSSDAKPKQPRATAQPLRIPATRAAPPAGGIVKNRINSFGSPKAAKRASSALSVSGDDLQMLREAKARRRSLMQEQKRERAQSSSVDAGARATDDDAAAKRKMLMSRPRPQGRGRGRRARRPRRGGPAARMRAQQTRGRRASVATVSMTAVAAAGAGAGTTHTAQDASSKAAQVDEDTGYVVDVDALARGLETRGGMLFL